MNIHVLGAHSAETRTTKFVSLLIDGILAIDAGALTSSLSLNQQQKIKAILLTHKHFDHVRDIPTIAINLFSQRAHTEIFATEDIYKAITDNLLNGMLYPNFFKIPEKNPTLQWSIIKPNTIKQIEHYSVLAITMNHEETTVGYQITSPDNKTLFYTADTGGDLIHCWKHISPQLLFTEVTMSNRHEEFAIQSRHLTPNLLKIELQGFRSIKGYIPSIIAIHLMPNLEQEIRAELEEIAKSLDISIKIASEGLKIQL